MLNLVEHLPRHSAYVEAVTDDMAAEGEQRAAESGEPFDQKQPSTDDGPPLSEWSPEVDLLAQIVDLLQLMRSEALQMSSDNKGLPYTPTRRPATVAERVDRALSKAAQDHLMSRFYPDRGGD